MSREAGAGGGLGNNTVRSHVPSLGGWAWGQAGGSLYDEVQCSVGNGHMGSPCGQNDEQTQLEILPFLNYIGGR